MINYILKASSIGFLIFIFCNSCINEYKDTQTSLKEQLTNDMVGFFYKVTSIISYIEIKLTKFQRFFRFLKTNNFKNEIIVNVISTYKKTPVDNILCRLDCSENTQTFFYPTNQIH